MSSLFNLHCCCLQEAKFCENCIARPLGYLTGKRASMVAPFESVITEENGILQRVPLERVARWYRALMTSRDTPDED